MSFHENAFDLPPPVRGVRYSVLFQDEPSPSDAYCCPPLPVPVIRRTDSEMARLIYDEPPAPVPVDCMNKSLVNTKPPTKSSGSGPKVSKNIPMGLEYLTNVEHLTVKQSSELLEVISGCEGKNKYKIFNEEKQMIYSAEETTNGCHRNFLCHRRPFHLVIKDQQEREVLHLSRPLACNTCFCPCWLQSIEVSSPQGTRMGSVEQDWSFCSPKFSVKDANGETILHIQGPLCTASCCGDIEFKILCQNSETKLGRISQKWGEVGEVVQEALLDLEKDDDTFGVSFPKTLDVRMKAVLIGACFLIDFMFFEK